MTDAFRSSRSDGTVTDSIGKAPATIEVTSYGAVYDGAAHTATGTVTINGKSTLTGGLAADKLVVNGGGVLVEATR